MSQPDIMLTLQGVSKSFSGLTVLSDLSFEVRAGERVALIGPNGAGKSTCFNVIDGQLAADAGSVRLREQRIDGLPTRAIAARGVGRTFQVAATFASMSVRENVQLALLARDGRDGSIAGRISAVAGEADALLAKLRLSGLAAAHCAGLAYGDAKRVELALALARRPQLLLMDEPTAGAGAAARQDIMAIVDKVSTEDGTAVLFTEHDMDVVFEHAHRVVVLDRGAIIAAGTPPQVRADPRVQAAYLGVPA